MLSRDNTVAVLVDLQVKLARAIHNRDALVENVCRLVRGLAVLEVPILWAEQNPDGLGPTVPEVAALMPGSGPHGGEPIAKRSFSCCGDERFMLALEEAGRKQVLLAGIEAHVCVYQTAAGLVSAGWETHVVADAVSSRTPENRRIGLEMARQSGALVTSVEAALFELLGEARGPEFKRILDIVK